MRGCGGELVGEGGGGEGCCDFSNGETAALYSYDHTVYIYTSVVTSHSKRVMCHCAEVCLYVRLPPVDQSTAHAVPPTGS